MNAREAKRIVCRVMAVELDNQLAHADWISEYAETDEDVERIEAAARDLVDELSRRGQEFA